MNVEDQYLFGYCISGICIVIGLISWYYSNVKPLDFNQNLLNFGGSMIILGISLMTTLYCIHIYFRIKELHLQPSVSEVCK